MYWVPAFAGTTPARSILSTLGIIGDKERFYEYFVKQMMKRDNGALAEARVTIDGSGDRQFKRNLGAALRSRLKQGTIKDVRFKDSRRDSLLQLADMCVGAIARSYRSDRDTGDRWRKMLESVLMMCGNSNDVRPRVLTPAGPGTRTIR